MSGEGESRVGLGGVGIGGYRSFASLERLAGLGKVNVIIGPNNAGKSNVIRFLCLLPDLLQAVRDGVRASLPGWSPELDVHRGASTLEFAIELRRGSFYTGSQYDEIANMLPDLDQRIPKWAESIWIPYTISDLTRPRPQAGVTEFESAIVQTYSPYESGEIARRRSGSNLGSHGAICRNAAEHIVQLGSQLKPEVHIIPCYRQVTADSDQWELNGSGLVGELNRLKEPALGREEDRKRFEAVSRFVSTVLNEPEARLEIPHTVDGLIVDMNGRRLPLESLGTGIHQVIILAAAATTITGTTICIEEPEVYLHPLLQKQLIRYLADHTDNQYIITTHSNAFFDCHEVNLYRCHLNDKAESRLTRVLTHAERYAILDDLGYRPSDIVQANCIVWVEGPSDRIYLNRWIQDTDPALTEGLHYSIMFYGGRLLRHLSAGDDEVSEFIRLRRLNRNVAVIMDSDKRCPETPLNDTKKRVIDELKEGRGFCWVTGGREIENYISEEDMQWAVRAVHGDDAELSEWGQYARVAECRKGGKIDKIKLAKKLETRQADYDQLDLRAQVNGLVRFIRRCNGMNEPGPT